MNKKMSSAIEKITLNTATFSGEEVKPSFINFFYGRNGAGKSTIARVIDSNNGIEWQDGKTADDYDVLVYSQDFIDNNFSNYDNLPGVFTVCDTNIEIQKQIDQKTADKAKLDEEARTQLEAATGKTTVKDQARDSFKDLCWKKTGDIQSKFKEAMKGYGRKEQFMEHALTIPKPVEHDLDIALAGTSATLLARRWESALLVNVDNDTLTRLMNNKDALDALMKIEGFRSLNAIAADESLGEGFCIGHSYFCNISEISDVTLSNIVEYEIIPLLKEYWFDEPLKVKDWTNNLRSAIK